MSEKKHTSLAVRFADWYDEAYNTYIYGDEFEKAVKEAEGIIGKYLSDEMYEMNTDDCVDKLPDEGRLEIEKFLEEHILNGY